MWKSISITFLEFLIWTTNFHQRTTIPIRFLIQNIEIEFRTVTFLFFIWNRRKRFAFLDQRFTNRREKNKITSNFLFLQTNFFRKSDVFIAHVVWFCPTCLSVVYGSRTMNSSIVQLYELNNDRIELKSSLIEENGKIPLLSRYLRPFFSSNGTEIHFIRFDRLTERSFPRIVRFNLTQAVRSMKFSTFSNWFFIVLFYSVSTNQRLFTNERSRWWNSSCWSKQTRLLHRFSIE